MEMPNTIDDYLRVRKISGLNAVGNGITAAEESHQIDEHSSSPH